MTTKQAETYVERLLEIADNLADLVLAIPNGIDPRTREMAKRFKNTASKAQVEQD